MQLKTEIKYETQGIFLKSRFKKKLRKNVILNLPLFVGDFEKLRV
jgi:hypothetical protein